EPPDVSQISRGRQRPGRAEEVRLSPGAYAGLAQAEHAPIDDCRIMGSWSMHLYNPITSRAQRVHAQNRGWTSWNRPGEIATKGPMALKHRFAARLTRCPPWCGVLARTAP